MKSKMHMRHVASAVLLAIGVGLVGCDGGGSGISSGASGSVVVAPTLGRFTSGTTVVVKKADGTILKNGQIVADGTATLDIGGHTGVIVVEVQGGAAVRYYDEASGTYVTFPAGEALRAVTVTDVSGRTQVAVTALTNAAAEQLDDPAKADFDVTKSASEINQTNTEVALQFGLSNIITPPKLVDDNNRLDSSDKYALVLAAISQAGKGAGAGGTDLLAGDVAKRIAEDLKEDGTLDGKKSGTDDTGFDPITLTDPDRLKTLIDDVADNVVKPEDKTAIVADAKNKIDNDPIDKNKPALTDEQKDAIDNAGSAIQQAKQFFANLRDGLFPYANDLGTGFLDKEAKKLDDEVQMMSTASYDGLDFIASMVSEINALIEGVYTPGGCTQVTPAQGYTVAVDCSDFPFTYHYELDTTNKKGTWSITGGPLLSAQTGEFTYTGATMTLNGYAPPVLVGSHRTVVGQGSATSSGYKEAPLIVSRTLVSGDIYKYSVTGTLKDQVQANLLNNSSTPTGKVGGGTCAVGETCLTYATRLRIELGNITYDLNDPDAPGTANGESATMTVNEEGFGITTMNLVGKFISENYRLIGTFVIDRVDEKTESCGLNCSQMVATGGKGSFTGTVSGMGREWSNYYYRAPGDQDTGNNFDILVGKIAFDFTSPNSSIDDPVGTLSFNGDIKKSADDDGIKLVVTYNQTSSVAGLGKGSILVTYTDSNKLVSISGNGSYDDQTNMDDCITYSDANGISAKVCENVVDTEVKKGDTLLAKISGGRITYEDGSFESLL